MHINKVIVSWSDGTTDTSRCASQEHLELRMQNLTALLTPSKLGPYVLAFTVIGEEL